MREHIEERCIRIGQYIVETGAIVRAAAAHFGVSKSSVHKDMGERLPHIQSALARDVQKVLKYHKSVRHLRGGEATRLKYQQRRSRAAKKEGFSDTMANSIMLPTNRSAKPPTRQKG